MNISYWMHEINGKKKIYGKYWFIYLFGFSLHGQNRNFVMKKGGTQKKMFARKNWFKNNSRFALLTFPNLL